MNEKNLPATDRERIATLEGGFNRLVEEVSELTRNIKSVANMVQSISRPNFSVWLSFAAIIIALIGGGMVFVDMRINSRVQPLETAVRSEYQARNIQWATQHRLDAVLWNASPLGQLTRYPEAPYFYPNGINNESIP